MGRRVTIRSKFLVLTPPRLQHEDLWVLLKFHLTSFRERSSDHQDSGPKNVFSRPKHRLSYLPDLSSSRGLRMGSCA
jgi:hypothetical protein